jgi:heparan-alpha-glucosaminide N-acetyltransferase
MKSRLTSIDIFRALTMFLMIFVNDLWTLDNIPGWLEHTRADEDGMGLADVVFPAFLFIVGLSVPFAVKARINKGDSIFRVFIHILRRSLSLVIMGFYMVNQDSLSGVEGFKTLWQILMLVAFILIWNDYGQKKFAGIPVLLLQFTGIAVLVLLAVLYRSGPSDDPGWMKPQWWGILGLIGWAYLVCASLYLVSIKRGWLIPLFWLTLYMLNFLEFHKAGEFIPGNILVVGAANHALVMSGILATQIYLLSRDNRNKFLFPILLLIPAIILLVFGFSVRPFWGISKILATPSWTAICAGISYISFAVIFLITDISGKVSWAKIIMPAGRSTLTCYLLPGLVYPFLWPLQQQLPEILLMGIPGLIKSLLFALFIIILTGLLEKIDIRLRI